MRLLLRRALTIAVPLLLAVLGESTPAGATPAELHLELRAAPDVRDLERALVLAPDAVNSLLDGERALARGELTKSVELFHKAAQRLPKAALFARRECQALTRLGKRAEALGACGQAIADYSSAMDLRAAVGALMSAPPDLDELAQALLFAEQAERAMPQEPFGYAAECDIAYRTGDATMLADCQRQMRSVAPLGYEAARLEQAPAHAVPLWIRALWGVIAASVLFTLGHALWRVKRGAVRRAALAAGLVALGAFWPSSARASEGDGLSSDPDDGKGLVPDQPAKAGGLSQWKVNPSDPASSVPTTEQRDSNPVEYGYHVMDLADLALAATKRGDFAAAASFYAATVKAVPDAAVGYRHACESYEKANNFPKAIEYCRGALGVQGVHASDYLKLAGLLLSKEPLEPKSREDLDAMIEHLSSDPQTAGVGAEVECSLAVRLDDAKRLERCTAVLAKAAPTDPKTISYQWELALMQGDVDRAEHLIGLAKTTDMKPDGIRTMERVTSARGGVLHRLRRYWLFLVIGVVGAGVAGLVIARRGRSITPTTS